MSDASIRSGRTLFKNKSVPLSDSLTENQSMSTTPRTRLKAVVCLFLNMSTLLQTKH